jgi:hypothetical protein
MNDLMKKLTSWEIASKAAPEEFSLILIYRLSIINTSPQHVLSKDMPPIG